MEKDMTGKESIQMEQKKTDVFRGNYDQRKKAVEELLHLDVNFDILHKELVIGNKRAVLYSIDGFLKSSVIEKMLEFFSSIKAEDVPEKYDDFVRKFAPFADITTIETQKDFVKYVLAGLTCFFIEGYQQVLAFDLREYPGRNVDEPEKDKVLRGSRDGFIEALIPNAGLIRRRIRDTNLIFQMENVGRSSKTDVAVIYMKDRVKQQALQNVIQKIQKINVDSLSMNKESLAEVLFPRSWYNPFPKFKYTERPDATAACLLEGSIVIMVDNSPAAMIIPTS